MKERSRSRSDQIRSDQATAAAEGRDHLAAGDRRAVAVTFLAVGNHRSHLRQPLPDRLLVPWMYGPHVPVGGAHGLAVAVARAPARQVIVRRHGVVVALILAVAAVVVVRIIQVVRLPWYGRV